MQLIIIVIKLMIFCLKNYKLATQSFFLNLRSYCCNQYDKISYDIIIFKKMKMDKFTKRILIRETILFTRVRTKSLLPF